MEDGTLRVVLSRWDTSLLWAGTGTPAPIVGAAIVPTFLVTSPGRLCHYPNHTPFCQRKFWLAIVTKEPINFLLILEGRPQKINKL